VLQQQVNNCFAGDVVRRLQAQAGELPVLADQFGRCLREQVKEVLQVSAGQRLLEILDDVELDVPLAQDAQRAAAVASARVEVDAKLFHRGTPQISGYSCDGPSIAYCLCKVTPRRLFLL
jgi:hypothetical protein